VKEICLQLLPVFTERRLDNYAIQTNVLAVIDLHIYAYFFVRPHMGFDVFSSDATKL
jgi:K+-sensing histidine kinase KdpD